MCNYTGSLFNIKDFKVEGHTDVLLEEYRQLDTINLISEIKKILTEFRRILLFKI